MYFPAVSSIEAVRPLSWRAIADQRSVTLRVANEQNCRVTYLSIKRFRGIPVHL